MKKNLKKLTLSFITTSIFSLGLYYIINLYDNSGTTILRIKTNINYLIFLYISIIISLTIYNNEDKKSKFILFTIILINFLYISFSFGVSNIGLNKTQGLFLLGFLTLSLISIYIDNIFGHIITALSISGILLTISLATIPMYEIGPDIDGFEKQFFPKLLTYSKVNINKSKAFIKLDEKEFSLLNGLKSYELKINKSGSQLLFISDKKYLNTFGYLMFSNKDIIQIYPQSAININKSNNKYQIEIITGIIKHTLNTGNNTKYILTGKNNSFGIINDENYKTIEKFYKQQLKEYLINQMGGSILKNNTITNISKILLEILSKISPGQYSNNLENFYDFQNYINPNGNEQKVIEFNTNNINKGILKNISKSLELNKIIK